MLFISLLVFLKVRLGRILWNLKQTFNKFNILQIAATIFKYILLWQTKCRSYPDNIFSQQQLYFLNIYHFLMLRRHNNVCINKDHQFLLPCKRSYNIFYCFALLTSNIWSLFYIQYFFSASAHHDQSEEEPASISYMKS